MEKDNPTLKDPSKESCAVCINMKTIKEYYREQRKSFLFPLILKGTISQYGLKIVNVYDANKRASEYMNQKVKELQEERPNPRLQWKISVAVSQSYQNKQTESQKRNSGHRQHYQSPGPDKHLQNTVLCDSIMSNFISH